MYTLITELMPVGGISMPCKALVLITTFPDTDASSYVWKAAVRPVFFCLLTYCCKSMYVGKKSLKTVERLQTKLLKARIGLHKYCKSTPGFESTECK